jgi:hypothetical protein
MATARFLTAATLSVACLSLGACSGRQNGLFVIQSALTSECRAPLCSSERQR